MSVAACTVCMYCLHELHAYDTDPASCVLLSPLHSAIFYCTGRFLRDKDMCTELVVPDLIDCKLKPYIASGAKRNVRELNVVDIQQVA